MTAPADRMPDAITGPGVLAIVRGDYGETSLVELAEALVDSGVQAVEMTTNSPGALDGIRTLGNIDGLAVGAGTVLTRESAARLIEVGATFLVMPHVDEELIGWAAEVGVATFPGAFTATECLRAWRAGATAVKLFPAALGPAPELGPAYLASLRGPLNDIPFVPTGGVSSQNAAAFVQAGAVAVAAGSWLVPERSAELSRERVVQRGRALVAAVAEGRAVLAATRPEHEEVS